ncbi:hypothetical protein AGMMS49992_18700 [Clostridia bacterium]|nr:hypothetical protein AGMMS49992_18700 [Clostridia bacterium]
MPLNDGCHFDGTVLGSFMPWYPHDGNLYSYQVALNNWTMQALAIIAAAGHGCHNPLHCGKPCGCDPAGCGHGYPPYPGFGYTPGLPSWGAGYGWNAPGSNGPVGYAPSAGCGCASSGCTTPPCGSSRPPEPWFPPSTCAC